MPLSGWQIASRMLFLVLFTVLVITGKIQLWMAIFVISLLLSPFFGRFYCGWICPINTVLHAETRIKRKFSIKDHRIPAFLAAPYIRYLALTLFLITLFFTITTGNRIPVFLILFVIGAVLTLFYSEAIWHARLCPYGALLSLAGAKSRKSIKINRDKCINCGICQKVCPGQAVVNGSSYSISTNACLLCLGCYNKCPQRAISYQ